MAEIQLVGEAEADVVEALNWIWDRSPRAARRFKDAISNVLQKIAESPERFPMWEDGQCRFAILRRFPYILIFRSVEGTVQVVAVAHSSRRPGYWSEQL